VCALPHCARGDDACLFVVCSRWDLFVPLHRLWLGYMSELLALNAPPLPLGERAEGDVGPRTAAMPQAAGMHAKLVKADFHGSIMIGQFIVPASLGRRICSA
jgi:hypothetical protein